MLENCFMLSPSMDAYDYAVTCDEPQIGMSKDEWLESVEIALNGEPVEPLQLSVHSFDTEADMGDCFEEWEERIYYSLSVTVENPCLMGYGSLTIPGLGDWTPSVYYDHIEMDGFFYLEKHEHDYSLTSSTAATCTTAGSATYTCSTSGESYTETIAATGHKLAKKYDTKYHWDQCSACGAVFNKEEHNLNNSAVSYETVNGTSYHLCPCDGCDYVYREVIIY